MFVNKSNILYCAFLFFFCNNLFAQSDSLFVVFPQNEEYFNSNVKLSIGNEVYTVLNYNFSETNDIKPFYSVYLTDYEGVIQDEIDVLTIEDEVVSHVAHFQAIDEGYLLFANVEKTDASNLFISFILDDDLQDITPVDTIILADEEAMYFRHFNYNETINLIEGFGELYDTQNNIGLLLAYLGVTEDGYFEKRDFFEIDELNGTIVADFEWIASREVYFFSPFLDRTAGLLDTSFNLISTMEERFTWQGDFFHPISGTYNFLECEEIDNDIFCSSISAGAENYSSALAQVDVQNENFNLDTIYPLLPFNVEENIVNSFLLKDLDNNLIGLSVGNMNPTNNFVEPNRLYITKIDSEGNILWNTTFENSTEMMIRAAAVDSNNDIVIVGEHWSDEFIGERQNFLLKIYQDGTLTSTMNTQILTNKIKVIPNPTKDFIRVEIPNTLSFENNLGVITDSFGRVIRKLNSQELSKSINLASLPSGIYYINISLQDGTIVSEKIIKH